MKKGMLFLIAITGVIVVPCAAIAQDLSTEEIRDNLQAQIRARKGNLQNRNQAPSASRGLKINNGNGDYVGDLYKPRDRPAPVPAPLSFQVEFEPNSSRVTAGSFRQIYKVAQAMRDPELAGEAWMVVGHTDSSGSSERNMRLSEQRAQAVTDTLAKLQSEAKFFPVGRGEEEPLKGVKPTDGKNRRVEIFPASGE